MIRELIDRYAAGADVPARSIKGLTANELDAFPVPGTWSIRQIVAHLMDSDLIAADRMKRIIAENEPQIIAFDETAFAAKLHYDKVDAAAACDVFRLNRVLTAALLRELPEIAFKRMGKHNERGPVSLEHMVKTYADHLDHHVKFIVKKREMLER